MVSGLILPSNMVGILEMVAGDSLESFNFWMALKLEYFETYIYNNQYD